MKPAHPVILVSAYLLVYAGISLFQVLPLLTGMMFFLSPLPVVWMVYRVLRYDRPSGKTFDEHFYEDYDYRRLPDND